MWHTEPASSMQIVVPGPTVSIGPQQAGSDNFDWQRKAMRRLLHAAATLRSGRAYSLVYERMGETHLPSVARRPDRPRLKLRAWHFDAMGVAIVPRLAVTEVSEL